MRFAPKCLQGTLKSKGLEYLGSGVFWISLQGEVVYIRSEIAVLHAGTRFALVWR